MGRKARRGRHGAGGLEGAIVAAPPLNLALDGYILVGMTRIAKKPPDRWPLQDAKARFSELVRRVRSDGPQHVTVHGRDEVVIVTAEEFHRLKGDRTGATLIAALQSSPYPDTDIEPPRGPFPVRDVKL